MRRFKTTPKKKIAGMLILFVFIPIFLIWYWVFFLDNKPGLDTGIVIVAVAALLAYLYLRYKKEIEAIASPKNAGGEFSEEPSEEPEELDEEIEEPAEKPFNKK